MPEAASWTAPAEPQEEGAGRRALSAELPTQASGSPLTGGPSGLQRGSGTIPGRRRESAREVRRGSRGHSKGRAPLVSSEVGPPADQVEMLVVELQGGPQADRFGMCLLMC